MNSRFLSCLLFICSCFGYLNAQDLPEITPLSPNAASITKYGEIPVGHFTGIPNVGIPIYTVSSGELTLPLSLSYHAGGNRVESIASWVGLGWSLGNIPSISRNVRGIPDENNGYFSKYSGKTVEELFEMQGQTPGGLFDSYRASLYDGTADSEPDIFSYALPSESGKFFYNQGDNTFITYPKSNTKIERAGSGFKLTTQDGIEYVFNIIESTNGSNTMNTSWYASKMLSASKQDTIRFTYQIETHITKTKNVVNKYHYLAGTTNGLPSNSGSILTTNSTNAMVLDSIIFDKGYVKFYKNSTPDRDDLSGGHKLNSISIYNNNNQLINKHEFTYRFKQGNGNNGGGTACYQADSFSKKWMLLDKVEQVSTTSSNDKLTHSFTYNESSFPACRYSAAQDYWGYYNGEDQNADLTPPYYLPGSNNQIAGADRGVNPIKSHYGILTKITYPTGGYTEFDFENNEANANDLPPTYVSDYQSVAGEEYFPLGQTPDGTDSFQKTFTINNPPDPILNNNNPSGGATVNFIIGEPGCDLSGGSSTCAYFSVTTSTSTIPITIEGKSFYLPNGTYTMTASFDQSPAQYQYFYFIADWQEIDPNSTGNTYVGGLRIKETRSYPSATAQPITKKYKYTTAYDSMASSGNIFSNPNFSHTENIKYITSDADASYTSILLRVRSVSNVQQVTHSGSAVGYKTIFEESDNPDETGYTEYQFSNTRDMLQSYGYPHPPTKSLELERGQLLNQKSYKKNKSVFDLVQDKSITYTKAPFETTTALYPKYSFAIKWGSLIINESVEYLGYDMLMNMVGYNVYGGWNNILTETDINYTDNGIITTSTYNYYDNATHLLKTKTTSIDSQGDRIITTVKYPQDITSPTSSITGLITQNRLGEVIETKSYKDLDDDSVADTNELLSTQQNDYRVWYNSLYDVISPEFIKTSKGTQSLEDRIIYHDYYDNGNVKEVSKEDGAHIVYLWGYNEQYPIAKIENFTGSQITTTVQNLINAAVTASDNDNSASTENSLRTALTSLRNSLPNSMITTYTYDPLVGVTSTTDPKGYTIYYEYDNFNRLKMVKDADGNILSENQYHYKGQ